MCLGIRMDAISLEHRGRVRYARQQEGNQRYFGLLCQYDIQRKEFFGVISAVIWWNPHTD